MSVPLTAFLVHLRQPAGGAHTADTAALDWFVIATQCCFFFLLGCFAAVAWGIWRRTTRPEPHEKLLQELAEADEDEILRAGESGPDASRAPWERQADWWRRE
ncbi:MAG TPA: hypothetical protein DIT64_05005 [Verrucomicrobiales bacterium]|nr:hypothetical protein [Verrucomicrobiales bacterium]